MNLISKPVKVILVDDSLVVLHILKKAFAQFSEVRWLAPTQTVWKPLMRYRIEA